MEQLELLETTFLVQPPKNNDRIITRLVVVVIGKNKSEISAADQNSIRLEKTWPW